jgi:plasmid stability protein
MPDLSIKNAPEDVVARLRDRARLNRRSLQGELLTIIEDAVRPREVMGPRWVLAEARRLGLRTADSAVDIIRADRDGEGR